jgi:hypothetical protein
MNDEVMMDAQSPVMEERYAVDDRPKQLMAKEYKPKKQEVLRDHHLGIRFLSVGCVVSVGCKEIPFRSVKEAMEEVNKYVENPYEESKRWKELFDGEE